MKIGKVAYAMAAIILLYAAAILNLIEKPKAPVIQMTANRFEVPDYLLVGKSFGRAMTVKYARKQRQSVECNVQTPQTGDIVQLTPFSEEESVKVSMQELQKSDNCHLDEIISIAQQENELQNYERSSKLLAFGKYGFRLGPFVYNKRPAATGSMGSEQPASECQSGAVLEDR